MKKIIAIALLAVSFASVGRSQTQREMNEDAFADLQRAEAELTGVYQKALHYAETENDLTLKKIYARRKAWIVFRDAHLEAIFPAEKRYSARPMAAATPSEFECTDYMTETDYLNGRLVYKTDKRSFDTVRECKQWAAAKCEAAVAKIRN